MNVTSRKAAIAPLESKDFSDDMEVVRDIPAEFPRPFLTRHGKAPSAAYEYRNSAGNLVFIVARYDKTDGKFFMPFSAWRKSSGEMVWVRKGFPGQRPLYRLHDLTARPDMPILVSEGEKCADAATSLGYPSISWAGGSNAVSKTDFSPLAGREVLILPDHDEAGTKATEKLVEILEGVGAASVEIFDIAALASEMGKEKTKGFDIADALAAGLTKHRFDELRQISLAMMPQATTLEPLPEVPILQEIHDQFSLTPDIPDQFFMSEEGLFKDGTDRAGRPFRTFAGSPLIVLGRTKLADGRGGWGYLIAVRSPDSDWHRVTVPARLLAGDGKAVREILAENGFTLPQKLSGKQALSEFIAYAEDCPIIEEVKQIGWTRSSFVLPDDIFKSTGDTRNITLEMAGRVHFLSTNGTLVGWQEMARKAEASSRATFALCVAFAAPLLRPLGLQGGGFHFWGQSSRGKTTLLSIAGSVWGGGGVEGFVRTWRTTSNGAEGLIADHNDILLPLDELTMVEPEQAADLCYQLANGQGKARAKKDGTSAPSTQWKALMLSSGENTLAHQIEKGLWKSRMTGGLAVRMIDVPIEIAPGRSYESIGSFTDECEMAEALKEGAFHHYGHAGRAFVAALVDSYDGNVQHAKALLETQIKELVSAEDDPQVRRVAQRFALAAAAGILAAELGILPVKTEKVISAVQTCFQAWKEHRGSTQSEEEINALRQLRYFFEKNGPSRFEKIVRNKKDDADDPGKSGSDFTVRDRCGYREETDNGARIYYVLPESWKQDVCGDVAPNFMARVAKNSGALIPGEGHHLQKYMRFPDYHKPTRVYAIRADKLE
jgi:uncharacterized protein (DUF927 family)